LRRLFVRHPGADILSFDGEAVRQVAIEETSHDQITRGILLNPNTYWKHLQGHPREIFLPQSSYRRVLCAPQPSTAAATVDVLSSFVLVAVSHSVRLCDQVAASRGSLGQFVGRTRKRNVGASTLWMNESQQAVPAAP
jgi:hypothetical protein